MFFRAIRKEIDGLFTDWNVKRLIFDAFFRAFKKGKMMDSLERRLGPILLAIIQQGINQFRKAIYHFKALNLI